MRTIFFLLAIFSLPLGAAEISVLCAGAARGAIVPLIEPFQRDSGHTIRFDYGTAGQILEKLKAGARPDVVIVTPAVIGELERAGIGTAGPPVALAKTGVGVGVAEGAPRPDIGSVDAFRRALLSARAIAYIDPAAGGTSGRHFAGVLARLGIAAEVNRNAVLVPGGYAAERVAKGEADLVVHQISEILPVKGVALVGPLPAELQLYTTYTAAIIAGSPQTGAARAWIDHLTGPAGRRAFAERGLDPP